MSWLARALIDKDMQLYQPSFDRAFDHFCIHTGGRGILDSLEKQLSLSPAHLVPSREALKRYGNTSSSSIWCATPPAQFADVPEVLQRSTDLHSVACGKAKLECVGTQDDSVTSWVGPEYRRCRESRATPGICVHALQSCHQT